LHVHVEVEDFSKTQLAILAAYWVKIEPYFCHAVPQHRSNNKYCKNLRNDLVCSYYKNGLSSFWEAIRPATTSHECRRKSLNLCNIVHSPNRPTVEFRFPESTLDSFEIKNWIRMFVLFIDNVKSLNAPKDLSIPNRDEFMTIVGLQSPKDFIIGSKVLHDLKMWFFKRILIHSRSEDLKSHASEIFRINEI
jgi:hypothetical protein